MTVRGAPCEDCGLRATLDALVGASSRCPHWLNASAGIVETNSATGETRLLSGCAIVEQFRLMSTVIAASNRPAAAIESCRNEIAAGLELHRVDLVTGLGRVALALASGPKPIAG